MASSTLITDYLGEGLASARPASLSIAAGALGLYRATDTGDISAWTGSAWVTLGVMPSIAAGDLMANTGSGAAVPIATTVTALLDKALGSTQGQIIYRDASAWAVLAPGTSGNVLATQGASANPHWISAVGGLTYQGTWNANTNTPTLVSGTGTLGFYYVVATAGTTTIDGVSTWNVGDWISFDGTKWDKLDGSANPVSSVAGRQGAVVLTVADVSGTGISTSDPGVAGKLWLTSSGQVAVSGTPPSLPLGFIIPGKPTASQPYNLAMAIACSINANFSGTVVYDGTQATANAVFSVNKISGGSTTAIGTLTITSGSHTSVTLSTQAAVNLAVGDVLQIIAPSSQDATMADLGITILATKI